MTLNKFGGLNHCYSRKLLSFCKQGKKLAPEHKLKHQSITFFIERVLLLHTHYICSNSALSDVDNLHSGTVSSFHDRLFTNSTHIDSYSVDHTLRSTGLCLNQNYIGKLLKYIVVQYITLKILIQSSGVPYLFKMLLVQF